jgi:hypothetical protein
MRERIQITSVACTPSMSVFTLRMRFLRSESCEAASGEADRAPTPEEHFA